MTHPELADTYQLIADKGLDGFYKGRVAQGNAQLATAYCRD